MLISFKIANVTIVEKIFDGLLGLLGKFYYVFFQTDLFYNDFFSISNSKLLTVS